MTDHAAIDICLVLGQRLGLGTLTPRVIGRFSNLAVALDPLPIVARIATGTALLRNTLTFAAREVSIAGFLSARGAPVVAPCDLPFAGPHQVDGWTVGLWRRAALITEVPDPVVSGRRLAQCHALLRDYTGDLPEFGALDELDLLLAHPLVQDVISAVDRSFLARRAEECRMALEPFQASHQALHGDSHRKNVLMTPEGPLWGDWEDTTRAPLEWDLACLVTGARINKNDDGWSEAALAAYGPYDPRVLDWCICVRAASGAGWLALLAHENPARLERLADWLAFSHAS